AGVVGLRSNCLTTSSQTSANGSVRVRHPRIRWFSLGSVDNRMYFRAVFGSMLACSAISFKVVLGLNSCRSRNTCSSFTIERVLRGPVRGPQAQSTSCNMIHFSCNQLLMFRFPGWPDFISQADRFATTACENDRRPVH